MFTNLFEGYDAFVDFFDKNDNKKTRKIVLRTDALRYRYCYARKDRKAIWNSIRSSEWACRYCINVSDRRKMWLRIQESLWALHYCVHKVD